MDLLNIDAILGEVKIRGRKKLEEIPGNRLSDGVGGSRYYFPLVILSKLVAETVV